MNQARLAEAPDHPQRQNIVLVPEMLKRHLIPSEETLGPKTTEANVPPVSPQSSKQLVRKMTDSLWICYWNRQVKEWVGIIFIMFTSKIILYIVVYWQGTCPSLIKKTLKTHLPAHFTTRSNKKGFFNFKLGPLL